MSENLPEETLTFLRVVEEINSFGGLISLIGILVALYTLWKVRSIDKAKNDLSNFINNSFRFDNYIDELSEVEELLSSNPTQKVTHKASQSITKLRTEISTAKRILFPDNNVNTSELLSNVQVVRKNYWTDAFASDLLEKTENRLSIVTWRNSRCFSEQMLSSYVQKIQDNPQIKIDIIFISEEAETHVYEQMNVMLDVGDGSLMKSQQCHHTTMAHSYFSRYLSESTQEKYRLATYEHSFSPLMHCLLTDTDVYWGINFFMDKGVGATSSLGSSYLKAPTNSTFGRKVQEQIDILKSLSNHEKTRFYQ